MRTQQIPLIALTLTASVACGKSRATEKKDVTGQIPTPSSSAAPSVTLGAPPAQAGTSLVRPTKRMDITLSSVDNMMQFDKKTLTVPTGAEVHLTFKNDATVRTLPHNWVLVKQGTAASVAAAGLKMGEPAGYVDVRDKDVLANTPLAQPGGTTEVTFTAPAPGTYDYTCTVPGHYMQMKGVLTVTP